MNPEQEKLEKENKSETKDVSDTKNISTYVLDDKGLGSSRRVPVSPRFHNCGKTEVKVLDNSQERGVFAKGNINLGEILEEVPFINVTYYKEGSEYVRFLSSTETFGSHFKNTSRLSNALGIRNLEEYLFDWSIEGGECKYSAIPLGNGCIYNSSPTPNAEWYTTRDSFVFLASKDIKEGEEIRTYYGYFLTDTGKKVLSKDNLGIYAEKNSSGKLCLRAVVGYDKSVTDSQAKEINSICEKGDLIVEDLKFYDSSKSALAELKIDTVSSSDSFYEKFHQAKINTNFFYLELNCREAFGEFREYKFVFHNR